MSVSDLIEQQRKVCFFTAKALYRAEDYESSFEVFKSAIDIDSRINSKQRSFFNHLILCLLNPLRTSLKTLRNSYSHDPDKQTNLTLKANELYEKYFKKAYDLCQEILSIIDQQLMPGNKEIETTIDLLRVQADVYRYFLDFCEEEKAKFYCERAACVYSEAFKLAQQKLPPHSSIRLSLVLNYAIHMFDNQKKTAEAIDFVEHEVSLISDAHTELSEAIYQQAMIFSTTLNKLLLKWKK